MALLARVRSRRLAAGLVAALVLVTLIQVSRPEAAPIQTFATSGAAEIDVVHCYDTNPANAPVQVGGRIVCNPANPATLPVNTPVTTWTVINLPVGNRLTLPTTFTPSSIGHWQEASVPCLPVDADNQCTDPGASAIGDFNARIDLGCNNPQLDIITQTGSPGGAIALWPDENLWTPPLFDRIAADTARGGNGPITSGDNADIHQTVPFPTTGVNAWDFRTSDLTSLSMAYADGSMPIAFRPKKFNVVSYTSTYPGQTGLAASTVLVGGSPDAPPTDELHTCLDSPFDTITETSTLITPNTDTRIPRWTMLQSAYDLGDSSIDRILDWQCDVIGTPADGDADGDCDPDLSDSNDALRDIDGDLVADGVERANNSNPTIADTDNDGCNDYCEIAQYTDPQDTDTDNDGQADKPDDTPTNGVGSPTLPAPGDDAPTTGSDAVNLTDDNCPALANPDQLNTDSRYQFHGMGTGTGDATYPDEDPWGDACDPDDDNDGIPGTTEATLRIKAWTGFTGAQTSVCVGPNDTPNSLPDRVLTDTTGDVDKDYVLDGAECMFRSRPDQSIRGTGIGSGFALDCRGPAMPAPPLDEGCAQPAASSIAPGGGDTEIDRLYLPGGGPANHVVMETYFRTRQINTGPGTQVNDIDGDGAVGDADKDSDTDLRGLIAAGVNLQDGIEILFYGTSPSDVDTDQDGCLDADEVNDVNGEGAHNSGDQGISAARRNAVGTALDNNGDGEIDDYALGVNFDFNKDGFLNSGDQGLLGQSVVSPGSCQVAGFFAEDNLDISSAAKGLP